MRRASASQAAISAAAAPSLSAAKRSEQGPPSAWNACVRRRALPLEAIAEPQVAAEVLHQRRVFVRHGLQRVAAVGLVVLDADAEAGGPARTVEVQAQRDRAERRQA